MIPGGNLVNNAMKLVTGDSIGSMLGKTIINGTDKDNAIPNVVSGDQTSVVHSNDGLTADDPSVAVAAGTQFVEQQNVGTALATRNELFPVLSENSQHIADNAWDSVSILSKPIKFSTITWNSAAAQFDTIGIVDIYYRLFNDYTHSRISRIIKSFRYLRTGFRFKIQLTSTKFNSGKLKVMYFPPTYYANSNVFSQELTTSTTRHLSMPGVELSACGPGAADLVAPFSACVPYYSVKRLVNAGTSANPYGGKARSADNYNWGTLNLVVLSPLKAPDTSASTVTITIWLQLETPSVCVPTRPTFNDIAADQEELENEIMTLRRELERLQTRHETQSFVSNLQDVYSHNRSLIVNDSESPIVLAQHATPIDSTSTITAGDDANSLLDFFKREGLLHTTTWNSTQAEGTVLFNFSVAPKPVFSTPATFHRTTPLAYGTLPFNYWRGGIRYRFSIVKTQFMQGRLQFFYSPGNDLVSTDNLSELYTATIDVSEASDFVIEVPFMYHKDWCINASTTAGFLQDFSHGSIICRVLNRLVTNDGSTSTADMLLYTSACDDFQVANIKPYTYAEIMPPTDVNAVLLDLQSEFVRHETESLLETTLPATEYESERKPIVLGTLDTPRLTSTTMNMDIFTTFSDLLSRPYTIVQWNASDTPYLDALVIPIATRIIPGPSNAPNITTDLITHFQNCFRYWNGGMIFTMLPEPQKTVSTANQNTKVWVNYAYNVNTVCFGFADPRTYPEPAYATTVFNVIDKPIMVASVPLTSQNSALMTDYDWYGAWSGPGSDPISHQSFYLDHNIQAGCISVKFPQHVDWHLSVMRSASKDFKFSFFIGVPAADKLPVMYKQQMKFFLDNQDYSAFVRALFTIRDFSALGTGAGGSSPMLSSIASTLGSTYIEILLAHRRDDLGVDDSATVRTLFGI